MNTVKRNQNAGFTFIEVLVAMLIFVLAVLAAVDIVNGAVRATRESKEITIANWLLQKGMTEFETKLETEGIEKGCNKKQDGKFDAPYEKYTWVRYCNEIDLKLSQTAGKMTEGENEKSGNEPTKEDMVQKMVLQMAGQYIGKSLRELHLEVNWTQGKQSRQVTATTHFVRYDQQLQIPALSVGGN